MIVRRKQLTSTQHVSIIISAVKDNEDYRFAVTALTVVQKGGQPHMKLTRNSIAGEYYVIQHTADGSQGPWVNASDVFLAKDDSTSGISSQPLTASRGYFRVKTVAPGFWTDPP